MLCTVWDENNLLEGAGTVYSSCEHDFGPAFGFWSPPPSAAYTCFRLGTKQEKKKEEWLLVYTCASSRNPPGSCTNTLGCYPSIGARSCTRMLSRLHHCAATVRWLHLQIYWWWRAGQMFRRGHGRNTGAAFCVCTWDRYQHTSVSGHLWETRYLLLFLLSIILARWGDTFHLCYSCNDKIE